MRMLSTFCICSAQFLLPALRYRYLRYRYVGALANMQASGFWMTKHLRVESENLLNTLSSQHLFR